MKIYLYLKNKILIFSIPQKVLGSYSFDERQDEEAKLINIEAREGKWYIYSTTDVSVSENGGGPTMSIPIVPNSFYVLKRSGIEYLIYITESFDNSFQTYKFKEDINLVIGNDNKANISYQCRFLKGMTTKIQMHKEQLIMNVMQEGVYLNNTYISPSKEDYVIKSGDQLNIYGFKIVFLNGFLMMNNPNNNIRSNLLSCKLAAYVLSSGGEISNIEFKDVDLYTKEQYFSKSPRFKRMIQQKTIKLSEPPQLGGDKQLPEILTLGPMLTMGLMSGVTVIQTLSDITKGKTTFADSWPQLLATGIMLTSMIFWPVITERYNIRIAHKRKKKITKKYTKYLNEKKAELEDEAKLQKEILIENLIPIDKCVEIINKGTEGLWDKRIDQNDFLVTRIGTGYEKLSAEIEYPEKGFDIDENTLQKKADELAEEYKYIQDVPVGYSLFKSKITGIMGDTKKRYGMIHNIILQLITFYSYEDIKIVVFTNKLNEQNWEYIRYLNHSISNDKSIRLFSTDINSAKKLSDYINTELLPRKEAAEKQNNGEKNISENNTNQYKPYYIIITDDYSQIRRETVIKNITEDDVNYGFSLVILEDQMNKLPSKCNNFIKLEPEKSTIVKDAFDNQEKIEFTDEIVYGIDMMAVTRRLSNIPIEFEEGNKQLPDSISFMEMEMVGKVEQLNIINRWETSDPSTSLRAEIGKDQDGNIMYLDLHEKYHGPHGLIAGTTGSGKSEFIITYILSMAVNYSPDDVAFILIDYKGGGLAGAFENKLTGVYLPHLAGTITNLDKSEMNRTLVSIDSEIKKRQRIFNEVKDALSENTIDIYKYQRYYKEGRLTTPVPHLFIICDEFAELKSQQPDFMDNLISVARIGRSLGVHLILATQKPSGVVDDQIWSNTKFRVCLKVQDEADSREMLKRTEAASIKQAGRFYLQVGYDEYFALGQSAWCGAKYYPSEKIVKQVDKSINFIDDVGNIIKRIQIGNNIKIQAQGEQISAVMNAIIQVANVTKKYTRKLWLDNVPSIILVDNLIKKYNITKTEYDVHAIIGEYDAPEKQEQGIVLYSLKEQGNTAIVGNDEVEKEKMLISIIYSIVTTYTSKEINIYIIDYGSEQLRMFNNFPQVGGMVFEGEEEKNRNLFKLIEEEIRNRKKALIPYGGSLEQYNAKNDEKLCQILFIINNYDSLLEEHDMIYDEIGSITRECERYGIYFIITFDNPNSLNRKISQTINNRYALHLPESSSYNDVFDSRNATVPKNILGRGLLNIDGLHEFQTASVLADDKKIIEYINSVFESVKTVVKDFAAPIPQLPEKITFDIIEKEIKTIDRIPIGIFKDNLKIAKYNFKQNISTVIASNKLININYFIDSLLEILIRLQDLSIVFIDSSKIFPAISEKTYGNNKINYYSDNIEQIIEQLIEVQHNNSNSSFIYILYGLDKLVTKVSPDTLQHLISEIKNSSNSNIIICDGEKQIKNIEYELWYSDIRNNSDGIWIGNGFNEQGIFDVDIYTRERNNNMPNNYGYYVKEGNSALIKMIEFNDLARIGDENE